MIDGAQETLRNTETLLRRSIDTDILLGLVKQAASEGPMPNNAGQSQTRAAAGTGERRATGSTSPALRH